MGWQAKTFVEALQCLAVEPAPEELLIDPYLVWACLSDFRGYVLAEDDHLDILAGHSEPPSDHLLNDLGASREVYGRSGHEAAWTHFTGRCTKEDWLRVLRQTPALRIELAAAVDYGSATAGLTSGVPKTTKATLAVIDDGCAVLNESFLSAGHDLRCVGVWDQGTRVGSKHPFWSPVNLFGRGRQLSDKLSHLQCASQNRDETDLYQDLDYLGSKRQNRRTGALSPAITLHTHGTHVLDLLAGQTDQLTDGRDAASEAEIVFVNLPDRTVRDSSGGSLGARVVDALHYIRLSTQTGGAPRPTVVNLSYGTQAGPHDGSSLCEQAIDEILERCPVNFAVVLGAGNSRRAQAHAKANLASDEDWHAEFELPDDDDTDGFVELWYDTPLDGKHPVVKLTTPDGQSAKTGLGVGHDALQVLTDASGNVVAAIVHRERVPNGARSMVLIALAGRGEAETARPCAPPGRWGIDLKAQNALTVDLWIERDDLVTAGERPMRFVSPEGIWDDANTLASLSSGQHTIVVGALRRSDGRALPYSSIGKAAVSPRRPDVFGPGAENDAVPGLLASGVRTGSGYVMGGTSVAAPVVARQLFNAMMDKVKTGGKVGRLDWGGLLTTVVTSCQTSHGIRMPTAKDFDPHEDLD